MGKLYSIAGLTATTSAVTPDGYARATLLVARAYPAALDFDEDDIREIKFGGRAAWKRALACGDFSVHPAVAAEAERIFDRYAIDRYESHNVCTNGGRTVLLNWIGNNITAGNYGTAPAGFVYLGANVFAVGTGSVTGGNAPTSTNTALVSEFYRGSVTNSSVSGNSVDLITFFSTTTANGSYTEAGLFGVITPPGSANTGTMWGRAAYSYTKTSSITLQNDYFIYEN